MRTKNQYNSECQLFIKLEKQYLGPILARKPATKIFQKKKTFTSTYAAVTSSKKSEKVPHTLTFNNT